MRNSIRLALATGAALAAGCVGATTAAAAPIAPTAASTSAYGYAEFKQHGEHLYACDTRADGRWVKAEIRWGSKKASVTDGNGSKSGCGHKNLSIKEGTTVKVRVVVEGIGAGSWNHIIA